VRETVSLHAVVGLSICVSRPLYVRVTVSSYALVALFMCFTCVSRSLSMRR
jgi:hypothetical protein